MERVVFLVLIISIFGSEFLVARQMSPRCKQEAKAEGLCMAELPKFVFFNQNSKKCEWSVISGCELISVPFPVKPENGDKARDIALEECRKLCEK